MDKKYYKKWLFTAPLGLVLVGAGLSLIGDAVTYRSSGAPFWHWFGYGTLALSVFNAGLSVFGQAIIYRIRYEFQQQKPRNP